MRSRQDEAVTRSRGPEPTPTAGVEANARLTGATAILLLVLLAAEGATIPFVRPLLTPHVLIGMVLVPPVLLKMGSTAWRFARYYAGEPEYVRRGAPPVVLRLLGPFVVVLTVVVFASGIGLLFVKGAAGSDLRALHKAGFVLWFGAMTVHVLGHLPGTARVGWRDWYGHARREVAGASLRQWLVVASVAAGLLLAVSVVGRVDWYRSVNPGGPAGVAPRAHEQPAARDGQHLRQSGSWPVAWEDRAGPAAATGPR
jgi:hypothetical protein